VVAKWTGDLDTVQLRQQLDSPDWRAAEEPEVLLDARTEHIHAGSPRNA
jgi:aerobic C4-dicarboxylate transport protein